MTDPDADVLSQPPPAPLNRAAPIALWRIGEHFLRVLFMLFGDPADVAGQQWCAAKSHALMARWIAAGEALMRRLLLIEAQYLALAPAKPGKSGKHVRKPVAFYADAPENWRVNFRSADRQAAKRASPGASTPRSATSRRFFSTWPLALRFEALLRAFNDPNPYARRLARRLARVPAHAEALLRIRADIRPLIGEDELTLLDAHRQTVARADSS